MRFYCIHLENSFRIYDCLLFWSILEQAIWSDLDDVFVHFDV